MVFVEIGVPYAARKLEAEDASANGLVENASVWSRCIQILSRYFGEFYLMMKLFSRKPAIYDDIDLFIVYLCCCLQVLFFYSSGVYCWHNIVRR